MIENKNISHINNEGEPQMVDVSHKDYTQRIAIAQATLTFPAEVLETLKKNNFISAKGSIIDTAIIAGTMAAKQTANLIPFCHAIPMESCKIKILMDDDNVFSITCTVKTMAKTGVEMEALTGASIAALTIYDMCKALSHHIVIKEIKLIEKTGGKSSFNA